MRDVLRGNNPLFFYAIMSDPARAAERKATLTTPVFELADCETEDLYIDLSITCVLKGDTE